MVIEDDPPRHRAARRLTSAINSDRFLVIVTVLISIGAIITCWSGVRTAETEILRYEAEKSAHSWAVFLRESLPHLPEVLSGQGVREEDQRVIHSASIAGQIFRYKFFNNDGKIVHASRPNDIGQTNIKWYFLELVKKGQSYEKIEREEDFGISRKVVSEAYVPIMKAGVFAGAIEVYVDVTDRAESLHRLGNYAIAGLILLLFVIGSTMGTVVGRN
ncbi:MAG: hypothetical protein ACKVG9_13325, partial [Rhodospirillales bacterium]